MGEGRLTPFSSRITPRRTAGRGGQSSGRTEPCTSAKHVRECCARWQRLEARPRALPPRYAYLPPAHGPEAAFFAGNFSKHFPRRLEAQRTRGALVREGRTQLSGLVRVAHVMRGMAMPEGTDPHGFSQKPGGVGNTARGDHPKEGVLRGDGRGCRRGNAVSHNAPAFPRLEDSASNKAD